MGKKAITTPVPTTLLPENFSLILEELMGNVAVTLGNPSDDSWIGVIVDVLNIGIFVAIWVLTLKIRQRDFSHWFMICQLIPMSLLQVVQFILDFNYRAAFLGSTYKWPTFEKDQAFGHRFFIYLFTFFKKTTFLNALFGVGLFLCTCILVARHRVRLHVHRKLPSRYLFVYVLVISAAISLFYIVSLLFDFSWFTIIYLSIVSFALFFRLVTMFASLGALCCCSGYDYDICGEPYISNARSRLGWSFLFTTVGFSDVIVSESGFLFRDIIDLVATIVQMTKSAVAQAAEASMTESYFSIYLSPFVLLLACVFFFPPYRSFVLRTEGSSGLHWVHSVPPQQKPSNIQMAAGAPASLLHQNTIKPTQYHPDVYQQQKPVHYQAELSKTPVIVPFHT